MPVSSRPLLFATWTTPHRADFVTRIAELLAPEVQETPARLLGQPGNFSIGPILPGDPADDRIIELSFSYRPGSEPLKWTLSTHERPEGEPPAEVREAIRIFGGPEAAAGLVEAAWSGEPAPLATVSVHAHVLSERYECLVLPVRPAPSELVPPAARDLGDSFDLDRIGLRLSGGAMGISSIAIGNLHSRTDFCVDVSARTTIELRRGSAWLPTGDDLMAAIAGRFFRERAG
jgi:hypothetical protein